MSRKFSEQFLCSRMMLPEHREGLNRQNRKQHKREIFPIPLIDEQQWEEFQRLLEKALEQCLVVEILRKKNDIHQSIIGTLKKADSLTGLIFVQTEDEIIKVKAGDVLSLRIIYTDI
ncbi:YolD-like family protein [Candidatus Contubernalis alkaliaceticus]|uniref:YolD-like family protein n=1 Tax=Candidatus Contubernalis alkaliaceticus TaxID=338645 RepID=UPI001F4C187E|nr:YolD-like family protein [Candidatus Contubernalis alkalaceticus]UNC90726.1 YolD-like family protein [Candidatus Contubernalis alkalaceticus]